VKESVKQLPELKKIALSSSQLQHHNFKVGSIGEKKACKFLQVNGFVILGTNLRVGKSEVDIVALDTQVDEVVFVEVKTRASEQFGSPSASVNYRKLQALRRAAPDVLKHFCLEKDYRFDIISVLPHKIEHFENVTW
jgi:putative endonuclease